MKYSEYLKTSGCCHNPRNWSGAARANITGFHRRSCDSRAAHDINGRDDEAIGLVFVLKDETGPVARVGITSDSKWIDSLPEVSADCE